MHIFWSGLLTATSCLLFGRAIRAEISAGNVGGLQSPSTTIRTATTASPDPTSFPQPEGRLFAEFQLPTPPIRLDEEAFFQYWLQQTPYTVSINESIILLLCQTSAGNGKPVDAANSWVVIQLWPCGNGQCPPESLFVASEPGDGSTHVSWTFKHNEASRNGNAGFNNFFLCFGTKTGSAFTCQTYSEFFDIEPQPPADKSAPGDSSTQGSATGTSNQDKVGNTAGGNGAGGNAANEVINVIVSPGVVDRPPTPTGVLSLSTQIPFITYENIPEEAKPKTQVVSTSSIIVTVLSSATAATGGAGVSNANGGGGGLPTGAKVGIALGVLVVVSLLACLAIFFCLRRRRAQPAGTKHEQVMLTHSHGENNSQDLLAEKDGGVHTLIHPNSNDSNFSSHDQAQRQTLIPAIGVGAYDAGNEHEREIGAGHERHGSTGGVGGIGIASYRDQDGNASSYNSHPHQGVAVLSTSPPRRKPTNASTAPSAISALSRNVSTSTTVSRPRSPSIDYPPHTHLQDIGEESNVPGNRESQPRYGETRHTPTVYTPTSSAAGGGFLSEPGMSAEEVARLEEEEARIDAAIAAAEEARDRERDRGLR